MSENNTNTAIETSSSQSQVCSSGSGINLSQQTSDTTSKRKRMRVKRKINSAKENKKYEENITNTTEPSNNTPTLTPIRSQELDTTTKNNEEKVNVVDVVIDMSNIPSEIEQTNTLNTQTPIKEDNTISVPNKLNG